MPTKPTDTVQQIATDTNFSSSPVVAVNGQPTKVAIVDPAEGLVPGRAAGAANLNWLWNVANKFIQWVRDGSSLASVDAHIVETDSTGLAQVPAAKAGGTAAAWTALNVLQNSGAPGVALNVANTSTGFAIDAQAVASLAATRSLNLGDGPGVEAIGTDGYGSVSRSDLTTPTRAAHRKVPQGADPTTALSGDEMHRSDVDIQRVYEESLWKSPWATARGLAFGISAVGTTIGNDDDANYLTAANCNLSVPNAPKFAGGTVLIHVTCRFGDQDSSLHHYFADLLLFDSTAGVKIYEWSNEVGATVGPLCTGAANADATVDGFVTSQFSAVVPYTIPAAGARTIQLRFKPNVNIGGTELLIGDVTLQVTGVYG